MGIWNSSVKLYDICCCCSVAQSRPTFCNPMGCSMPGCSVLHRLPESAQTHVHWVGDAMSIEPVMPSSHLILCHHLLLLPSIFHSIRAVSNELALVSGGQSIGAAALASVLPVNSQGWFPLGLTGLTSLLSKGLSRVFSKTITWYMWNASKEHGRRVVAGRIEETKWLRLWDVNSWRRVMDKIHSWFLNFFIFVYIWNWLSYYLPLRPGNLDSYWGVEFAN